MLTQARLFLGSFYFRGIRKRNQKKGKAAGEDAKLEKKICPMLTPAKLWLNLDANQTLQSLQTIPQKMPPKLWLNRSPNIRVCMQFGKIDTSQILIERVNKPQNLHANLQAAFPPQKKRERRPAKMQNRKKNLSMLTPAKLFLVETRNKKISPADSLQKRMKSKVEHNFAPATLKGGLYPG